MRNVRYDKENVGMFTLSRLVPDPAIVSAPARSATDSRAGRAESADCADRCQVFA